MPKTKVAVTLDTPSSYDCGTGVYTHQVRKYLRDIRDDLRRVVLRRGRGRDLGIGEGRSS